jgi:hypothetical protein
MRNAIKHDAMRRYKLIASSFLPQFTFSTHPEMKQPSWLANIGTFTLEGEDPTAAQTSMDQLTAQMNALYGIGNFNSISPASTASTELYTPPQRRFGATRSEIPSPLSSNASTTSSGVQEKTILCKFYAKGNCTRGEMCTFAHGIGDIKAARNGSRSGSSTPNPLKKTKLCRNLFGKSLTFSHLPKYVFLLYMNGRFTIKKARPSHLGFPSPGTGNSLIGKKACMHDMVQVLRFIIPYFAILRLCDVAQWAAKTLLASCK